MTLKRCNANFEFEMLSYFSKRFSVITDWDGGKMYVLSVYHEITKKLIEVETVEGLDKARDKFEELKTKHILS